MTASEMSRIDVPAGVTGPATLVTARSYMIDRFLPDCEIVALPEKEVPGGHIRFRRGPVTLPAVPHGDRVARLKGRLRPPPRRRVEGRVLFDLRHHDVENWAHYLNIYMPVVFRLCEETGTSWDAALLVVPQATPGHIHEVAAILGFELLPTDGTVEGEGVEFQPAPWTASRPARAEWVRRIPAIEAALEAATQGGPPLPERPFLARRDTRVIVNMDEVEACLAPRGYATVHAEDLSPADQMRLFREARAMVAIHGAGLAPLLYVPRGGRLARLVEILPVGHMTDVYRVMAEQVGVPWIGVRGRIKPEYVAPAYRLGTPFKEYSLDSFEVDVAALERALDLAGDGVDPGAGATRP